MLKYIVVLGAVLALNACSVEEQRANADTKAQVGTIGRHEVYRYGPDDLGVVCYRTYGNSLSCVYIGVEEDE